MQARNQSLARQAKRLQPFCTRCRLTHNLRGHHIVALCDGGEDAIGNVSVLCRECHNEWHWHAEGSISYEDFLDTIPVRVMLLVQASADYDDQTLDQLLNQWFFCRLERHGLTVAATDSGGVLVTSQAGNIMEGVAS